MTPTGASAQRLYFLDWLRIFALIVLVLFHTGMIYVTWRFHVKSADASHLLESWMKLTEPWRMSLLFAVSGASAALWLRGGASWAKLREKSSLLLWPLLFGMFVVVVPQAYFEFAQFYHFNGSLWDFAQLYYKRPRQFCEGTRCSILPTWNHLWFLPYLWFYTTVLLTVVAVKPSALQRLGTWLQRVGGVAWIAAFLLTAFCLARLWFKALFPPTNAFVGDWYNHFQYSAAFVAGIAFACLSTASQGLVWQQLARWRWWMAGLSLAAWWFVAWMHTGGWRESTGVAIQQTTAVFACLAWGAYALNRDHPWRDRLNRWVFPFYVLHQTVIICLFVLLKPAHIPTAFEGIAIVIGTLVITTAACWGVEQLPFLHRGFGFRPASKRI